MCTHNPFDNDKQFVISFELLQLLQWLFEHHQHEFKALIEKALRSGLEEQLGQKQTDFDIDVQDNIIDFFALLEALLYELVNENEIKRVLHRNLIPAIDQIDASDCDNQTMALSIQKATSAAANNPEKNPKEILCKEFLKRWRPTKKTTLQ